jgi:hypothetical protein
VRTEPPVVVAAGAASLQQLRSAAADLGDARHHVDRLAGLLHEAHATLGVLRGGDGTSGGVGVATAETGATAWGTLERQLVDVLSEVLRDVEGELRGVGSRLHATHNDVNEALPGLSAAVYGNEPANTSNGDETASWEHTD